MKIQASKKLSFKKLSVGDTVYHYFLDSKMLSNIPENDLIEKMDQMSIEYKVGDISKIRDRISSRWLPMLTITNSALVLLRPDIAKDNIAVIEKVGSDNTKYWNCYSTCKQPENVLDYIKNHTNPTNMGRFPFYFY